MTPHSGRSLYALHAGILRAASFLVPTTQRSEWHREWQSELWHARRSVCRAGAMSPHAQREITAFCLGSFQDAFFMRREFRHSGPLPVTAGRSAPHCILRLSALLALCFVISLLLPGVQAELDPSRYQLSPGLVLIDQSPSSEHAVPSVSAVLFRNWKATRQRYFDGFAFYRTVREPSLPGSHSSAWRVTRASLNLFDLLGLPVQLTAAARQENRGLPALILSHETWVRDFDADPRVAGRLVPLGKQIARVAGVLPYGSWRLPDRPDVWLLEPDSRLAANLPRDGLGFLIAHLTPFGQSMMVGDRVRIDGVDQDDLGLYAVSLADRLQGARGIFAFALILALLALPAVTSVTVGESNYSSHRPSIKRALYRWTFLLAKFTLVAGIGNYAALVLAYWNASTYSPLGEFAQFISCFSMCLLGFRWALADQRRRCPVCLHRVTNPATVGLASRTFLGWNGTEMMCPGGHTLLHVPSLPTSWFSSQRWLYLDSSWEFLFADSGAW